jgi:hypothetical protein
MSKKYIDKRTGEVLSEREIQELKSKGDWDSFLLSGIIAYATDSALLGGLLGGNFVGGVVGDLLNPSDTGGGLLDDLFD